METYERALLDSVRYLPTPEQQRVQRVLERAKEWHAGQFRDSGELYITHPIAVAQYLASLEADVNTLQAALLHDVVEDHRVSLEDVEKEFGSLIVKLVEGVTKLSKFRYEGRRAERQIASLRKMLLTASDDLRVIFIKLADRWHNVETISSLREDKRQRVAAETLDIYVPFARLVGLWDLKTRFEEVCFPVALPQQYQNWHLTIERVRAGVGPERHAFIQHLNEEMGGNAEVILSPMTAHEIYEKLQGNLQHLEDVRNVDSVLVVVRSSAPLDCYRALGTIHTHYPVWVGSFRDTISAPTPNGYRALHTTIFLAQRHQVRVRIQTQSMHEYSSRRKISSWQVGEQQDLYQALTSLHTVAFDQKSYLGDLRATMLRERINVFTPSGEIVALPQGATGVDFAFLTNPDHVSSLSAIRVNGDLLEATHPLSEGDTVQLVLLENGTSGKRSMWVDKVKSVEARRALKKSLRRSPREQQREEGDMLLEVECRKRRISFGWLHRLSRMQEELAQIFQRESFAALLEDLGSGVLPVSTVADAYAKLLSAPPSVLIRLLTFLHLLPRSRSLGRGTMLIGIEVYAEDRLGLISDISRCIAERKINIARFEVYAVPPKDALYRIRLEVHSFEEFSDLFDALLQVPSVKHILRKS